ncbi:MAG: metal-dependent hydrolase [Propionibacteriaceae bacterium]|jgi:membrane-bound metal-dependent hydrolase YbcI (DUF457 family)|nr:metal-dependent hydrolase [Propionibacteriaceae bacterium]
MLGRTHATSGAVAYLGAHALLVHYGLISAGPVTVVAATLAAAGAAMLPDLDHKHATITQSLGPITRLLTRVVSKIAGGHRQLTHSLLGVVAFTALAWAISQHFLPFALTIGLLFAIGLAALRLNYRRLTPVHTVAVIAITVGALWSGAQGTGPLALDTRTLPIAVAIGCLAHIIADMLTKEGCPLLYPLPRRLHILTLTTGGPIERRLIGPLLGTTAIVLTLWQVDLVHYLATLP